MSRAQARSLSRVARSVSRPRRRARRDVRMLGPTTERPPCCGTTIENAAPVPIALLDALATELQLRRARMAHLDVVRTSGPSVRVPRDLHAGPSSPPRFLARRVQVLLDVGRDLGPFARWVSSTAQIHGALARLQERRQALESDHGLAPRWDARSPARRLSAQSPRPALPPRPRGIPGDLTDGLHPHAKHTPAPRQTRPTDEQADLARGAGQGDALRHTGSRPPRRARTRRRSTAPG